MHICTMLRAAPLEYSYDINFIECAEETAIQKRKEVLYQSYCDLVSYCMCIVYHACMPVTYIQGQLIVCHILFLYFIIISLVNCKRQA